MHFGDATALPFRYLAWHYSRALIEAFALWLRAFKFATDVSAVRLHIRTFFSPFQRIEDHEGGDIKDKLASFSANTLMRVVGMAARICVIAFALAVYLIIFVAGIVAFFAWLLLPAAIAACFSLGLTALLR